jgi:hypothetical protein
MTSEQRRRDVIMTCLLRPSFISPRRHLLHLYLYSTLKLGTQHHSPPFSILLLCILLSMKWYDMVWYGMDWYMIWYGMVWNGMGLYVYILSYYVYHSRFQSGNMFIYLTVFDSTKIA